VSIDVSELLLDDADAAPSEPLMGDPPKRGRGRPRGSTTRKQAPATPRIAGARELAQLLAKLIGGASLVIALALDADEAAMTPQEANEIAKPAARLLSKSSWAARMLSMTSKGSDWIDLTFAVAAYGLRLYPLIVLRQQQLDAQRLAQKGRPFGNGITPEDAVIRNGQPQPGAAQPAASANGHNADAANADAIRLAGLGYANPDALAAGAYGDVAAVVRAYPAN
jgi:hypothetical protein